MQNSHSHLFSEKWVGDQLAQTLDRHLGSDTPGNLAESIRYTLFSPGKRIRPRLMLHCAEMLGLDIPKILPAALALEIYHCFTLVHDDLPCMDNDDFRRGLPSNHKKFGEGLALLAGDGMLALAMDVFLDCSSVEGVPHSLVFNGLKRFMAAIGCEGVIGGQAAEALLHSQSEFDDVQKMHRQKTGALFSAAMLIPMEFAEIQISEPKGLALAAFGQELGAAFQMADDIEDAEGSSEPAPTSVLFFMTQDEAANRIQQNLSLAASHLEKCFGQKASGLQNIANEVIQKALRAAKKNYV